MIFYTAKEIATRIDPTLDYYDQVMAIKRELIATPNQGILATDREFIWEVLDIVYEMNNSKED